MLNENIKNFRKQKGYSQETLAQELNVVRQTVSKWEKGYSVPDAIMLEKLSDLFEVSVGDLLGNTESESEQKPDLAQISAQLSVLNNQIAKELARKRKVRRIFCAIIVSTLIVALLVTSFVFTFNPYVKYETAFCDVNDELDNAISKAILKINSQYDSLGECNTQSHYIYGVKEDDDTVEVYLTEYYTSFGFVNGYFVDVGGHSIPAVFTFKYTDMSIELESYKYAQDGSEHTPSIKKMFPYKYAVRAIKGLSEAERDVLWINCVTQAQDYLSSINRNAVICKYSELDIVPLTDLGVSVEVSNKICEMKLPYDADAGNFESLENGKRYVYQTDYENNNNRITLTKFEYDTNKIVEFIAVDGSTGEVIKDAEAPASVKYNKGKTESATAENDYSTVAYYQ